VIPHGTTCIFDIRSSVLSRPISWRSVTGVKGVVKLHWLKNVAAK